IEKQGEFVSTMNAVICFFSLPLTIFGAVRAITTRISALVALVHQSFSPLMIQPLPSGDLTAVVSILAGSEPTPGSVSANAEIAPLARRGRYFFFCSGVPKSLSGCGTPID